MQNNLDINEISSILPHRYPFLLVDKIVKFEPNKTITVLKNVTINEPHFIGHFPDNLIITSIIKQSRSQIYKFISQAKVADQLVAEATICLIRK